MSEIVGEAVLKIRTDDSDVDRGATSAGTKAGKKAGTAYSKGFSVSLKNLAGVVSVAAVLREGINLSKDALAEGREAQKVGAVTAQTIKATGGAANVTRKQVESLSGAISEKVGQDDEAIQSGANLLLTFKNIRNEAGKGNKIFNQATRATVDLAVGMKTNARGAAIQLGKALNDPVKGVTALNKAGVTFTQQQKDQIKTLVQSGHTLEAQKVILKEVNHQVGGVAAAQATAGDKFAVSFKNLEEQVGTALIPTLDKLATTASTKWVPAVSEFVSGFEDGTGAGGDFRDTLEDILGISEEVIGFFTGLPGPVKKYGIELAIAAVAVNKLGVGVGGMSSRLSAFSTSISSAETRSAKLTTGLRGLGAGIRNIAGAGGMVLLADGASKADTSIGKLEATAGGALAGAALGAFAGPAGAAVGAALGGLAGFTTTLYTETKNAGDQAKVQIGSWKNYTTTLDGVSAATTKATRDMAFQRLLSSGLLAATQSLGLSDRQAVNAILGVGTARQKLSNRLARQNDLTIEQKDALEKETGAVGASRLAQLQKNVAIARNATELQNARTALRNFMKEPARKRLDITGVEGAKRQANTLKTVLSDLVGGKGGLKVGPPGGLGALLGVDKTVQTRIDIIGLQAAQTGILALNRMYGLTPKQVETELRAAGEVPTKKRIQSVIDKANEYKRLHPTTTFDANTQPARDKANSLVGFINNLLAGNFTANIRANVSGGGAGSNQSGTTNWRGGMTMVGEAGPEMAWLPRGAQIKSAAQTRQFTGPTGSGGGPTAREIGTAVVKALVTSGAVGPTIVNPLPEPAHISMPRVMANVNFLLGG